MGSFSLLVDTILQAQEQLGGGNQPTINFHPRLLSAPTKELRRQYYQEISDYWWLPIMQIVFEFPNGIALTIREGLTQTSNCAPTHNIGPVQEGRIFRFILLIHSMGSGSTATSNALDHSRERNGLLKKCTRSGKCCFASHKVSFDCPIRMTKTVSTSHSRSS